MLAPYTGPNPASQQGWAHGSPRLLQGVGEIHVVILFLTQAAGSAAFSLMLVQNTSLRGASERLLLGQRGWFCFRSLSCGRGLWVALSCPYSVPGDRGVPDAHCCSRGR